MTKISPPAEKKTTPKPPSPKTPSANNLLHQLQQENQILQEKSARALADYQNLVRRQNQEQAKVITYAKVTIFTSLLQPLEHLTLAAKSLNDQGLDMVVKQFWQALENQGLTEFNPDQQKFNPETMEAVEKKGDGDNVLAVVSPGYRLDSQIIKVARVKVG